MDREMAMTTLHEMKAFYRERRLDADEQHQLRSAMAQVMFTADSLRDAIAWAASLDWSRFEDWCAETKEDILAVIRDDFPGWSWAAQQILDVLDSMMPASTKAEAWLHGYGHDEEDDGDDEDDAQQAGAGTAATPPCVPFDEVEQARRDRRRGETTADALRRLQAGKEAQP